MDEFNHSQQNIVEFPRSKKERRRILRENEDRRVRICTTLRTVFGWLLVVSVFLFMLGNYRLFRPSSIKSAAEYAIAGLKQRQGDMSSINFENGSFIDAELFGSGIAYLSNDSLYLCRAGRTPSMQKNLGFSSPVLETAGDYVLCYDRGATGVSLTNSLATLADVTVTSPIVSGNLCKTGNFTIVTDENGYRTAAAVYDKSGKEVFKWNSSEYYIVSAVLSADGKTLCTLSFQQNGVSLETYVTFFSVAKGEKINECILPDSLGMSISCMSNGTVVAFCDNGLFLVDQKGNIKNSVAYNAKDILAFASENDMFALALRPYSGTARSEVYIVRSNGKLLGPFYANEEPSSLSISKSGIAALTASGIVVYSQDLEPRWQNSEAIGARNILFTDDDVVYTMFSKNARLFTASSERSEDIQNAE